MNAAPRGVQEVGTLLHRLEYFDVKHANGRGITRAMDRDNVGLFEQLLKGDRLCTTLMDLAGRQPWVKASTFISKAAASRATRRPT